MPNETEIEQMTQRMMGKAPKREAPVSTADFTIPSPPSNEGQCVIDINGQVNNSQIIAVTAPLKFSDG